MPEIDKDYEERIHRMCDDQYKLIQGVHNDLGHEAANDLYSAQTSAYLMMASKCGGNPREAAMELLDLILPIVSTVHSGKLG